MQAENQPKTTNQKPVRDAAVQISCKAIDSGAKFIAILEGVMRKHGGDRIGRSTTSQGEACADALSTLAKIISDLTNQHKAIRENGKHAVRELVKLGQEHAE